MDVDLLNIAKSGKVDALDKIEAGPTLPERVTSKGNTVLHIACRFGRRDFAAGLVRRCPELLRTQNLGGDTALHVAVRASHVDVAHALIERATLNGDTAALTIANNEGDTVLHEAAANRSAKVVRQLLEVYPNLVLLRNKRGAFPLYVAAEKGCLGSVRCILAVEDMTPERAQTTGPEGRTPLHAAIIMGHSGIADILINKRREHMTEKDDFGHSPFHYAAALGNLEVVRQMLSCDKKFAYYKDGNGSPPFLLAASNNHVKVMKVLFQSCPDAEEGLDDHEQNALHVAATKGNLQVVKYILHSEHFQDLINDRDREGNTPLHLAVSNYRHLVVSILARHKRVDVNAKNNERKTSWDILESQKSAEKTSEKWVMGQDLVNAGGKTGLAQLEEMPLEENVDIYKRATGVISTVGGLIVTVSFAAAFTIPGGFNSEGSDKGEAVFSNNAFLWLFIITDTLALCTSICVEFLSFLAVIGDDNLLIKSVSDSMRLMLMSLIFLSLSFLFGLFLILSKLLAAVSCIIFGGLVYFVYNQVLALFSPFTFLFLLNMDFLNKPSLFIPYRSKFKPKSIPIENLRTLSQRV